METFSRLGTLSGYNLLTIINNNKLDYDKLFFKKNHYLIMVIVVLEVYPCDTSKNM